LAMTIAVRQKMEITGASILDLQSLGRLERVCFGEDAWPFLDLVAVLTFPEVIRLKAVEDGKMIGFVAGDPKPSDGIAWIATIGVAPEFRRRGIGRELLRACESRMKEPRLRLSVRATNQGAIDLYEQEGYERLEVWQRYYRDGEAAIVMEKTRGA
jgi:ribosomal protein S18 acetylase RimI-like enzyme